MKINLNRINAVAILTRIAGIGVLATDATFQSSITALVGPYAPKIIAAIGLVSLLATDILNAVQHSKGTTTNVVGQ